MESIMQHAHLLQSNITEHDEEHRITWVYMCTYEKHCQKKRKQTSLWNT